MAKADSLYNYAHVSMDSLPAMRSLLYYQKAIDALAGDDTASVGRKVQILSKMGDLLATQMLYREAIGRYQLAYNYSVSLQDTTNMVMAYQCIGDMYRKLRDYRHEMKEPPPFPEGMNLSQMETSALSHTS